METIQNLVRTPQDAYPGECRDCKGYGHAYVVPVCLFATAVLAVLMVSGVLR